MPDPKSKVVKEVPVVDPLAELKEAARIGIGQI
jgi:hypothetical protein